MELDRRIALGDYIRDAREARRPRVKQQDVADAVGVSRGTITSLERGGLVNPKIDMLQKVADALDIPVGELFARAGISQPDAELGALQWLAEQLDRPNLRRLVAIGHALLREQLDQPRKEAR